MKLYLDVSCLNRPYDDQRQPRVRTESEAVLLILARIDQGTWTHVSSEMAAVEIDAIKDAERRARVRSMLPPAPDILPFSDALFRRADELQLLGIKAADATHVAAAELHKVDAFLTCDDRLLKAAKRHRTRLRIEVNNPLNWIHDHDQRKDT